MKELKIVGIVAVLLLLACLVSTAQAEEKFPAPEVEWNKTFAGSGTTSIIQTSDRGYAVAGWTKWTKSEGLGEHDVWVIKLDKNGNKIWDKTFDESHGGRANSIIQTSDGGYAVAGYTGAIFSSDVWVIKLDKNGNKVWDKTFGGNQKDWANSIIQTPDEGYAVAGVTTTKPEWGWTDAWVIKLDENGNTIWGKTLQTAIGERHGGWANSIIQTPDGGYAVAGKTSLKEEGSICHLWVIMLDENGNKVWDCTFGENNWARSIVQTSDGGYAVAGWVELEEKTCADVYVIKLDENGNEVWDKALGGNHGDWANSIIQTSDRGYAVAGYTRSKGKGGTDIWIIKLDEDGNKVWDETFGESGAEGAYSIIQTSDGGYAVAGYTGSKGAGKNWGWVIKIEAESVPPAEGIPTGEEKGIPGFEAIFAIAGLLAVAYVLRRSNK